MKKAMRWIPVVAFFGLLWGGLAMGVFCEDRKTSAVEGRNLAQFPTEATEQLPAQLTDYVVDQFPGRNALLKAYTEEELLQGKWEVRDTYVVDAEWLMTPIYPISPLQQQNIVDSLEQCAIEMEIPFFYGCVPQKNDALEDLADLVDNQVSQDNKAQLMAMMKPESQVVMVDIGSYFNQKFTLEQRKNLYYKTDFHWNHQGAFQAASYIGQTMVEKDIMDTALTEEQFTWQDYTGTPYQGDLNRRFSNLFPMTEQIPYYQGERANLSFYWSVDQSVTATEQEIFPLDVAQQPLNYNALSTENLGYYQVVNPYAPVDKSLLIVKDSYENPMTEYFIQTFRTVHVIDPRSYKEPYTIQELIDVADIDVALFVYHQNNASRELLDFLRV